MRDMEYLTEKDLPYFEKKVKKGEAVIIYIDPDALLEAEEAVGKFLELEEQRRKDKAFWRTIIFSSVKRRRSLKN